MLSPEEVYLVVREWLLAMELVGHRSAVGALAHLVTALLLGQRLAAASLMRAVGSRWPVPARQRYRRVARAWRRPWLTPGWLTPRLVRAALALVAPDDGTEVPLILDSLRCGRWELFTVGVAWHGRLLPVGWAVLPYPWPRGQFTPLVCALVRQVAVGWPAGPRPHLLADRGFPSQALFVLLRQLGWGWTIRLRARDTVTAAGTRQPVCQLLVGATVGRWSTWPQAQFGGGKRAVTATVVVGRGMPVLPSHQHGPGSLAARARQRQARQAHLREARRGQAPDAKVATDPWVVLFTTASTWRAAVRNYRRRWATEGSYRDVQGGWDGQHGWGLERLVAGLADRQRVEGTLGLWALGALIQLWVGVQLQHSADPLARAVAAQWTTTGRLSVWTQGRLALSDPSGLLRPWLTTTLHAGTDRLAAAPPLPATVAVRFLRRTSPLPSAA
jgi:hypothetical protein